MFFWYIDFISYKANISFDKLVIKDDKGRSLNSFVQKEILYLDITYYNSKEEIKSLAADVSNSVFDNCMTLIEFSCVAQHQNNPFKTNKIFSFQCSSEESSRVYSEFNCLFLNLERTIKFDDKNNQYFYSGVKIGPAIADQLCVFNGFLNYKILAVDYDKKETRIITITSKDQLAELLVANGNQRFRFYELDVEQNYETLKPLVFLANSFN